MRSNVWIGRMGALTALALLALSAPRPAAAQTSVTPDGMVAFLRALEGRWFPANRPPGPGRRPPPDYVIQAYDWTVGGMTLRLREGYRGDPDGAELDGFIFWNPASERVEFVAVAGHRPGQGRTFAGHYYRRPDGAIVRTYDVTYRTAADTPGEELGGRVRRYREIFVPVSADSLEVRLDWWRDGDWQPFGPGTYAMVRRRPGG